MMLSRHVLSLMLLPLAMQSVCAAVPLRLVLNDQSSPPYLLGNGAELENPPGLVVELVQQAAQACDVSLQVERQSSLRQLQSLRTGNADAVPLLSYSPERAQYASYPMRHGQPDPRFRLTTLAYSFYVRKGSPVRWDGKQLSGYRGKVGTDLGWSVAGDLARLGIAVENAVGVATNLAKLRLGRIDVYAAQDVLVAALLQGDHGLVALRPAIVTKDYYLPFSLQFSQQYGQVVQCMWQQTAGRRAVLYQRRGPSYGN